MAWTRVLAARLRALWSGDTVRGEIDEEYRFHIELRTDENIARGMSLEDARRDAEQRFGHRSSITEAGYDVRGGGLVETVAQDVRFSTRVLRKNPGFALVAVVTLALGIGATTAIFSVVDAVLLRPLPFESPDRLIVIRESKPPTFPSFSCAPGNFLDWKAQNDVFERLVAVRTMPLNLTGSGEPERLRGLGVTEGFFAMLGVQPQIGRDFVPEEQEAGHSDVVILSHGLWQRRFGGDPGVVGRPLTFDGKSYTVLGVMPATFSFLDPATELWTPVVLTAQDAQNHGGKSFLVVGRLKPDVSVEQARTEMTAIAARMETQYPDTNVGWGVRVAPVLEFMVGDLKATLLLLLGAVGFVLLIACANVANLLLARAASRHREIAVRVALGASRWRVVRQLLTESVLLAAAGSVVGLLLAKAGMELLLRLAPENLPRIANSSLDVRVLLFTGAITMLTAVVFGLIPAFQASKTDPNDAMKEASRGSTEGRRRQLVRSSLVVVEVASALVLLVGAGLLVRSFWNLQSVNPGFDPEGAMSMSLALSGTRYPEEEQRVAFFRQLLDGVRALPGVEYAGAASSLPLGRDDFVLGFTIQGRPPLSPDVTQSTNFYATSDGYFEAMGIPLRRGRLFTDRDTKDAPRVAIINETMAARIFPDEDPIGKRMTFDTRSDKPEWYEIVGVVGDVRHYGLDKAPTMQTYEPFTQQTLPYMTIVARTTGDPATLAGPMRGVVAGMDREQPITATGTLDRSVSASTARQQFSTSLLGVFAAVALLLAAIGLYGLLSYSVTQRTHEIGIRMALGAGRRDVLRFVVGHGMLMTTVGILIGFVGAIALSRTITTMLFEVNATDPATLASIALILAAVALAACLIPAWRATKVDPLVALRHD